MGLVLSSCLAKGEMGRLAGTSSDFLRGFSSSLSNGRPRTGVALRRREELELDSRHAWSTGERVRDESDLVDDEDMSRLEVSVVRLKTEV